jgi:hypothetical protein
MPEIGIKKSRANIKEFEREKGKENPSLKEFSSSS